MDDPRLERFVGALSLENLQHRHHRRGTDVKRIDAGLALVLDFRHKGGAVRERLDFRFNARERLHESVDTLTVSSTYGCLNDDLAFLLGGINECIPLSLEGRGGGSLSGGRS